MVYILGGWQSDFSDVWSRRDLVIAGAFGEAVQAGLSTAALDHLGITQSGKSWQASKTGRSKLAGGCRATPSGGLIGLENPVGATGARMLLDADKQVSGNAGDYQVEGANRAQTLNIGGSTTTTVSFIVEAAA